MEFLTEWVRNIVLIILVANFIEMLLPESSTKKDVQMVIGLFIILAILSPIINLVNYRPSSISLANIFYDNRPSFQEIVARGEEFRRENQQEYNQHTEKLAKQIESLIKLNSNYNDITARIKLSEDRLEGINILIRDNSIKNIRIDLNKEDKQITNNQQEEIKNLKELISAFYGIEEENIEIKIDQSNL